MFMSCYTPQASEKSSSVDCINIMHAFFCKCSNLLIHIEALNPHCKLVIVQKQEFIMLSDGG